MDIQKFTERTQGFLQAAQTIAIREFHQRIAPEHLLKALLDDEEGAASGLIRTAGGDPAAVKSAVEAELARQPKVTGGGAGQPQAAPELVRLLDAAQSAAAKAGDEYVAQDRLLVAIAGGDGPAARALRNAGATPQTLERAVTELRKGRKVDSANAEASFDALKKYARDVTAVARDGKLDPVIGRDEEIRRTIQVLSRRTKNNPVLIGEPGVGKTAIVEGLAQRIVNGDVPEGAEGQAGTGAGSGRAGGGRQVPRRIRGAAEAPCLQEIEAASGEIIVFIDELHTIGRARAERRRGDGRLEHAQARALARGDAALRGRHDAQRVPSSISRRTRRWRGVSSRCSSDEPSRWSIRSRSCVA